MSLPSSILIYGHDMTLLDTRRWVLEKAGFRVETVSSLPAVMKAMTAETHHLVILCHTLSSDERQAAISTAAGYRPAIRTLSICTNLQCAGEDVVSGETLDALAGAEGLIAAANELLTR